MGTSEEELREHYAELVFEWDTKGQPQPLHQPAARKGQRLTGSDIARMTAVAALARHVHDTAKAILLLIDADQANAATALVRQAFEDALTAAWLVQSRDQHGVLAFLHEHARSRSNLKTSAMKAINDTLRDNADTITGTDMAPYKGSLDNARQFAQICEDLTPGGYDAYVLYRILCSYSHATVQVVDLYFAPAQLGESVPQYREDPDSTLPTSTLLYLTVCSMVWSARAYSYLTHDKEHRNSLRRRARDLGTSDELHLSQKYHERHAKNARQAKHAPPS